MKVLRTEIASDEAPRVCELEECFPDDTEALLEAREDIVAFGVHYAGGGASPVVKLEALSGRPNVSYSQATGSGGRQWISPKGHIVPGDEYGPDWEDKD